MIMDYNVSTMAYLISMGDKILDISLLLLMNTGFVIAFRISLKQTKEILLQFQMPVPRKKKKEERIKKKKNLSLKACFG